MTFSVQSPSLRSLLTFTDPLPRTITLTAGAILKEEEKTSFVGERQFKR